MTVYEWVIGRPVQQQVARHDEAVRESVRQASRLENLLTEMKQRESTDARRIVAGDRPR